MKLSEYLSTDRVVLLTAKTKEEALHQLVEALVADGVGADRDELETAIRRREQLMSTGIGNGLAIPHVRLPGLRRAAIAIGISREGLPDYESLDGEPIRIVVMIVAPEGEHETYVRLLAKVMDAMKQTDLREAILASPDGKQAFALLTEKEE